MNEFGGLVVDDVEINYHRDDHVVHEKVGRAKANDDGSVYFPSTTTSAEPKRLRHDYIDDSETFSDFTVRSDMARAAEMDYFGRGDGQPESNNDAKAWRPSKSTTTGTCLPPSVGRSSPLQGESSPSQFSTVGYAFHDDPPRGSLPIVSDFAFHRSDRQSPSDRDRIEDKNVVNDGRRGPNVAHTHGRGSKRVPLEPYELAADVPQYGNVPEATTLDQAEGVEEASETPYTKSAGPPARPPAPEANKRRIASSPLPSN